MKKSKAKASVTKSCQYCNECPTKFYASTVERVAEKVIEHFQEEHPLKPERCYDLLQKTWLPGYDEAAKAFHNTLTKYRELEEAYKKEAGIRNTLATKLNGIIMIIRDGGKL